MKHQPYIGITDFMTADEAVLMATCFEKKAKEISRAVEHKLMVGVVSYYETLHRLPFLLQTVPKNEDIASIFIKHPFVFNTIHYVDFNETREEEKFLEDLVTVTKWGGMNMHAIQLDMLWPAPAVIKEYRNRFPHIQIILQINTPAFLKLDNTSTDLVEKLVQYGNSVDFVALDKSMGRGIGLNHLFLLPILETLQENFPHISLVVAGGLGPDTLGLVKPLVEEFSGLSIDAESGLRSSKNVMDPIDWGIAQSYLEKSLDLFYA